MKLILLFTELDLIEYLRTLMFCVCIISIKLSRFMTRIYYTLNGPQMNNAAFV